MPVRIFFAFTMMMVGFSTAFGQSAKLAESVKVGELFRYEITMKFDGAMKIERDGKTQSLPRSGEASHKFDERIESPDAAGAAGKVLRFYREAKLTASASGETTKSELAADRRLTVAQRSGADTLNYSPSGPLTREELDLVAEHFDTLALTSLLPQKEIKVGESWTIGPDCVQHLGQFDGLGKHELKGTLTAVKDGKASFTIIGKAEGVSLGASVKISVNATGTFDTATNRLSDLTWDQDDDRERGPATPALEGKAKIQLKRAVITEEPKEFATKIPTEKVPAELLKLRCETEGKYTLIYPREWIVVAQTKGHLVLRLLDKGEFLAQVTIAVWSQAEKGKHTAPQEFLDALNKISGWVPSEAMNGVSVPSREGHWMYRVKSKGKQDGEAVAQSFILFAGPNGDQLSITVRTKSELAGKLDDRETELLAGLVFAESKK